MDKMDKKDKTIYVRKLNGQIVEKEEAIKDFIHRFDWYEPNYEWEMPQVLSYKCVEDCIDHCDFELVVSSIKDEDGKYTKYGEIAEETRMERFDFVKQSDDIKELCDAIVVKYSDEYLPRVIDMEGLSRSCKNIRIELREYISFLFETYEDDRTLEYVVGAVWYGEGNLKAVAKFNKKGELRLL